MKEPIVRVGILKSKEISFQFQYPYLLKQNGKIITGIHTVSRKGDSLCLDGEHFESLLFEPTLPDKSFILENVIIGNQFHWERKETQEFNGSLQFIKSETEEVQAINIIHTELYLKSVISSEMSSSASLALLKAHAVISRSWLLSQLHSSKFKKKHTSSTGFETKEEICKWYNNEDHQLFDVCADDHCQRYQGITRCNNINASLAVQETRGEVLTYNDEICDTRYSKSCGGVTELFENCWEDNPHPYLTSVPCSDGKEIFCNTSDPRILKQVLNNYDQETTNFYRWTITYTQKELSDLITEKTGINFGNIQDLKALQRGPSGRIVRLQIQGDKCSKIIGKELEIRRVLSQTHLYSSAFEVEKQVKDNLLSFTLHGKGWGHGVGLCQIGAAVMGEKGYSYQEILTHYYQGSTIKHIYK